MEFYPPVNHNLGGVAKLEPNPHLPVTLMQMELMSQCHCSLWKQEAAMPDQVHRSLNGELYQKWYTYSAPSGRAMILCKGEGTCDNLGRGEATWAVFRFPHRYRNTRYSVFTPMAKISYRWREGDIASSFSPFTYCWHQFHRCRGGHVIPKPLPTTYH